MLCYAVFGGVQLLHIVGQRHLDPDVLLGAFHGKTDVVGQRKGGIGAEGVGQFVSGDLHDAGRKGQHIFGQFRHQLPVLFVRVVEGPLDLAQGQLPRETAEADAFSHGDQLPAAAIPTERHIVVDPAQCLHRCPSLLLCVPPTKKKPFKANGTALRAFSTRSCLKE